MTNQQWHTMGSFPDGNTVIVTGAAGSASHPGASHSGGGLPVTGPGIAALGSAGLALVPGGALTFVLLRRRRIRFVR